MSRTTSRRAVKTVAGVGLLLWLFIAATQTVLDSLPALSAAARAWRTSENGYVIPPVAKPLLCIVVASMIFLAQHTRRVTRLGGAIAIGALVACLSIAGALAVGSDAGS